MARGPDILAVQSIPLSATSDQPVETTPGPPLTASGNADDQASGVSREITAEELAATARKADPATSDMADPAAKTAKPDAKTADEFDDGIEVDPRSPNFAIQEITKVRRQARDRVAAAQAEAKKASDEAVTLKAAAEKAQQELDALRAKTPEPPKVEAAPDPRPTRDQFDDPDAYDTAVNEWADREADRKASAKIAETEAANKKAADDLAAAAKAETEQKAREAHEAAAKADQDKWEATLAVAKAEKYEDWDEVVLKAYEDGGPRITPAMSLTLTKFENGPDIGYYLAQNREESERISAIADPLMQAANIGMISQQLAQPVRPARRARPIEPIDGSRTPPANADPDNESMDSYYARRTPEMTRVRQPFFPAGAH